jgi:excisionase family DNA binding protein
MNQRNQTVGQVAADLNVSDEQVRRAIRAGAPADRLGRRTVRVSTAEIRQWLAEREAERTAAKGAAGCPQKTH